MKNYLLFSILILFTISCKSEIDTYTPKSVTDYVNPNVGKYITYRLDSTVFVNSGNKLEIHRYQVKHTVISETTDNIGRKSFLIQRLLRDSLGATPWVNNGTYTIISGDAKIEVVENNLRSFVLVSPIQLNYTWKGNSAMPFGPYRDYFEMDAGNDMNKWDFEYLNFADTTIASKQYKDVVTIMQSQAIQNIPPPTANSYGYIEYATDKFAKGIGLIYRNFQLYEHQPPNVDNHQETYYGFGIKMWIIDNN